MKPSRTRIGVALAVCGLAGVAVGVVLCARLSWTGGAAATTGAAAPKTTSAPTSRRDPAAAAPVAMGPGMSFAGLVKQVSPAVAHIFVKVGHRVTSFFGTYERYEDGQGTGFLITTDGFILTNNHVVGNASVIRVRLEDDRTFEGQVVGTDPDTDIALIKIADARPFPSVQLGDSDPLEIGEWVVAIGNPFGLDHTVTAGIVSAKGRRDVFPNGMRSPYYDFIQTDASINPGNSGGPLINMHGEVIGINSAVAQGQGIGFAIPINMAKLLLPQLKANGRVRRSRIGVGTAALTQELAAKLTLTSTAGALITSVVPGSPAEKFGLRPGEVIVSFDGKPIHRPDDLPWLASTAGIGRSVPIVIAEPGGKRREMKITLDEKPDSDE